MATFYILYSPSIDTFYVGSCFNLEARLTQHNSHDFEVGFTHRASDWQVYYHKDNLDSSLARRIEVHVKNMKSRKYLMDLKKYPAIFEKLIEKYDAGSSR